MKNFSLYSILKSLKKQYLEHPYYNKRSRIFQVEFSFFMLDEILTSNKSITFLINSRNLFAKLATYATTLYIIETWS